MSPKRIYHHGNLSAALIDTGIDYVNKYGYDTLSLRKLATMCDVSHAAVYKHFASKEDLFTAMKLHVKEIFANKLQTAIDENKSESNQEKLYALAVAYVELFIEHPAYYNFIYSAGDIAIDFDQSEMESNYRPFVIFRDAAIALLNELGVEDDEKLQTVIGMWAVVHGITQIAVMEGTKYSGDWTKMIRSILESNFYIRGQERCDLQ